MAVKVIKDQISNGKILVGKLANLSWQSSLVGKFPVKMSHLLSGKISWYACSCLLISTLYDAHRYKISAMVLMIFSYQDVPSLVGKYPVKMSHHLSGKISGYACSFLLIPTLYDANSFKPV